MPGLSATRPRAQDPSRPGTRRRGAGQPVADEPRPWPGGGSRHGV